MIGVIEPGARAAVAATRNDRVGVIGTAGTVASGAYRRALLALRPELEVVQQACPLLVPFVEEGWLVHPATRMVIEEYLVPLRTAGVDVLVLGCTHYPLLKPLLTHVMGQNVRLIDSALETARELARVLEGGLAAPAGNPLPRTRSCCPCWVPAGTLTEIVASSVRTGTVAPRTASHGVSSSWPTRSTPRA